MAFAIDRLVDADTHAAGRAGQSNPIGVEAVGQRDFSLPITRFSAAMAFLKIAKRCIKSAKNCESIQCNLLKSVSVQGARLDAGSAGALAFVDRHIFFTGSDQCRALVVLVCNFTSFL